MCSLVSFSSFLLYNTLRAWARVKGLKVETDGVTMTESLSYSRYEHGSSPTSRSYFFFTFDQAVVAADEALVQFQAAYLVYHFFLVFFVLSCKLITSSPNILSLASRLRLY
jgi:hypothetical protein